MSFINFRLVSLPIIDTFEACSKGIILETVAKGRKGATIVNPLSDLIPIVRTTTRYVNPVQLFNSAHYQLIESLNNHLKANTVCLKTINETLQFNNAMVEIYDSGYRKMGFHSDQALDLAENSYICLFSCYENNSNHPNDLRQLKIQNKTTKENSEITLQHNSVVLFSTTTNQQFLHKIVLDSINATNRWLGLTFRLSKTFIKFVAEIPILQTNQQILRLATDEEKKTFHKCKGCENTQCDFCYPEINYTISLSDLKPIQSVSSVDETKSVSSVDETKSVSSVDENI